MTKAMSSGNSNTAKAGEVITVKQGGSITLEGHEFAVTFVEVTEDSRCPEGAHCMWAGQAKIKLSAPSGEAELIVPGMADKVSVKTKVGDYTVHCTGLAPYPQNGQTMEKDSYEARLAISL